MPRDVQEGGASSVLVGGVSVLALLNCRCTFGDGQRWFNVAGAVFNCEFRSAWIALVGGKMRWCCCVRVDRGYLVPSCWVSPQIFISRTFALKKWHVYVSVTCTCGT